MSFHSPGAPGYGSVVTVAEGVDVVRPVPEESFDERCADERDQQQGDDEDPPADRDPVAAKAEPDLLPVAARLDLVGLAELAVRLERNRSRQPRTGREQVGVLRRCHVTLDVEY